LWGCIYIRAYYLLIYAMSCFGAIDGLVGCRSCGLPDGPIGSLYDGCIDTVELVIICVMTVLFVAVGVFAIVRGTRWALVLIGMVTFLSSLYHLLFGEGVGRNQPAEHLDAINSRVTTIPVQAIFTAWLVSGITIGWCACCGAGGYCGINLLCWLHTVAAGSLSPVARHHYHITNHLNYDPGPLYMSFDIFGMGVGMAIVYVGWTPPKEN